MGSEHVQGSAQRFLASHWQDISHEARLKEEG